jgi:hypothetical protein
VHAPHARTRGKEGRKSWLGATFTAWLARHCPLWVRFFFISYISSDVADMVCIVMDILDGRSLLINV